MKRNMDLIRDILFAIEAEPPGKPMRSISLPAKYSKEEVIGHMRLVKDGGLVDGKIEFYSQELLLAIHGLSNRGHDFLDAVRSDTVWSKTQEKLKEVGGSAALETVKALATAIGAKLLGLT